MGRLVFDLARIFHKVVGVDYCARFLDVAMRLQSHGRINEHVQLDINENLAARKAVFKQMTWIPNEVPKSDLVVFTMLDRVSNPFCK